MCIDTYGYSKVLSSPSQRSQTLILQSGILADGNISHPRPLMHQFNVKIVNRSDGLNRHVEWKLWVTLTDFLSAATCHRLSQLQCLSCAVLNLNHFYTTVWDWKHFTRQKCVSHTRVNVVTIRYIQYWTSCDTSTSCVQVREHIIIYTLKVCLSDIHILSLSW